MLHIKNCNVLISYRVNSTTFELVMLSFWKWLGTRRSCLVVADTADTTVVSAVSVTKKHDRFFNLTTKDLSPFSIHIPTKKSSFTLMNDFVGR